MRSLGPSLPGSGSMEEKRRVSKTKKQCVINSPNPTQAPVISEDWNRSSPVGLSRDGASILEFKVRALKEQRHANEQGEAAPWARASPKKIRERKGKPVTEPSRQDAVVEPQAETHTTCLTDVLLDSTQCLHVGMVLASPCVSDLKTPKGPKATGAPTNSETSQRFPGMNIFDSKGSSGNLAKRVSSHSLCGASSFKELASGGASGLGQAKDLESISVGHNHDTSMLRKAGLLWRAESWDSLGSVGSNTSVLSLAERVERNRAVLQKMLMNVSVYNSHPSQEQRAPRHQQKETPAFGNDRPDTLTNDVDGNSGVSLQDCEGYRALVPRHEQAKQPLQRVRMKAKTSPLRARHNILPPAPPQMRDAAGTKDLVSMDGDAQANGNLSDSSSEGSSCGQHRDRGPSPSRVRFEDESARDAEVRYSERLQQRQKRLLDSVLLSLGQGPLISKPDLSVYINGDLQHKENGAHQACWDVPPTGQAAQVLAHQSSKGCYGKGTPMVAKVEGKCSACSSYVSDWRPDIPGKQTGNDTSQTCHGTQESQNRASEKELGALQDSYRMRTLGPKRAPLWQRVCTERPRATHIGEAACTDEVDSALDSTTDASDSYITDGEEAEHAQPQVGLQSPRGSGSHPRLSPLSQNQVKTRKAEREQNRLNYSCCNAREENVWSNGSSISRVEGRSNAKEACNSNFKGASDITGQLCKMVASGADVVRGGDEPADLSPLVKKDKIQGQTRMAKAQMRQATLMVCSHQLPSHLGPGARTDSVYRKPADAGNCTQRPTDNLSQSKQVTGLSQHIITSCNFINRVPAPPTTGKAPSSPMPYRRAVLTGSYKLVNQDPEYKDQVNGLLVYSTPPRPEEQSGPETPKLLSESQLPALSTKKCNGSPDSVATTVESGRRPLQDSWQMAERQGPSSLSCDVPAITPTLSVTAEEPNVMTSAHAAPSRPEAQGREPMRASTVPCKTSEVCPEPKKNSPAKKGRTSSSASGLKKFFTTLSQSTKQRLGRYHWYSMEQICATEAEAELPVETSGKCPISSPEMRKVRLVSPLCQPRKASSVQNLHSLLSKPDRSRLYLLGGPKDAEFVHGRKASGQHGCSLSVEDIGAPNLVRAIGRLVEVFPDGTSQLELHRSPQSTFGFCVSSGNGRPDTGIYVQEMADASTAKLYAGLLRVGDELLEVNGAKVAGLGPAYINELLQWADSLSVRVLRQRRVWQ